MYKATDFAYAMFEWVKQNPDIERADDIQLLCELLIADELELEKYEKAMIKYSGEIRKMTADITKILEK